LIVKFNELKKFWSFIVLKRATLYKVILLIGCGFLTLYLFPKGGQFKYEFQKGKPWQYPTLYAPFDFSILKSNEDLEREKQEIINFQKKYYRATPEVFDQVKRSYQTQFSNFFNLPASNPNYKVLYDYGYEILNEIYKVGVFPVAYDHKGSSFVYLIKQNQESTFTVDQFSRIEDLRSKVVSMAIDSLYKASIDQYYNLFFEIVQPNISLDEKFTNNSLASALGDVSASRGIVVLNAIVISKGEVVEGEKFQTLLSLKNEYSSKLWSDANYYWIIFGYSILIGLTFLALFLFLSNYRPAVFDNNKKMTFIFLNVVGMIALTTIMVNYEVNFLYAVPICILPLILKTFFDSRLGLFAHVITILTLGFVVPNSFEFVFLQIIAGIVTIQSVTQLQNRANLFITVGRIVFVYLIGYIAFTIIHEGGVSEIELTIIGLFFLNGLLTLFAQPLIYLCEKIFGLVSDVSLLELSDTNSPLLKELSDRAPGTFHHSLQVANLAETAANEIGANSLLVRVGALYHDIGKMNAPTYFSENQASRLSPHEELSPAESAKIIIDHVTNGIVIAKKNKLPERIIDFIRTHHGTSKVYYFYKKAEEISGETPDTKLYSYPGPRPFSKETAILMMSDAVEAASKSLKEPSIDKIQNFVESIVDKQVEEKQFNDCNITLAEIETVKKVLSKKLINIYHLRVAYPE
jgi:hypothetical protein